MDNIKFYQELYLAGNAKKRPTAKIEEEVEEIGDFEYLPIEESTFNT